MQNFQTKVDRIIEAIQQEHEAEGLPRPKVEWTGRTMGRQVELVINVDGFLTTGWTDGSRTDGYINFIAE